MLSLHIITLPEGYVGALRSNINKTKHQILIKHKGLTVKIYGILVCAHQQYWGKLLDPGGRETRRGVGQSHRRFKLT